MSLLLWQSFFEDDVEKFRHALASAGQTTSTKAAAGKTSLSTSPGLQLGASPTFGQKRRQDAKQSQARSHKTALTRADLNWRDANGITLLHAIASSYKQSASEFAAALLEQSLLDLYVQDEENGWTALHRALYFGNIAIARALMERDLQESVASGAVRNVGGLIKIKDKEGNSPFDVYGASVSSRSIRVDGSMLLDGPSDEDEDVAQGVTGDPDEEGLAESSLLMRKQAIGDEVFAFGSNKNFTLGLGDEDDRQYPERISLRRPASLVRHLHQEHIARTGGLADGKPPVLVQLKELVIHDVQLAKLHSAILTGDPVANLYICGFGSGGRLGTGDEATRFDYVSIGGLLADKKVIDVALGQNHTIAISSTGETFSWGSNDCGQLGYTLSSPKDEKPVQHLPRYIYGPLKRETVSGAAASRIHSAVFTSTALFTFGKNEGQLGIMDSDARSLAIQVTPRRVAAALFSSGIVSVTAIDKATVCLLQNHEVWVFANYGYTKLSFATDFAPNYFLQHGIAKESHMHVLGDPRKNKITKVTSGGDTICAMSTMGDVFTLRVTQPPLELSGSTTNPSKIRHSLSAPQRVWSTKKGSMAVHDVDVGQDGSIILCTESGSVWRRVKRAKIDDAKTKAKDFKFSRVPNLTGVKAVRSNAFGAFAAVRQDCDVMRTQMEVESIQIWKDVLPLLPLYGLGADDADTENPMPRFWMPAQQRDVASLRHFVLSSVSLEDDVASFLNMHEATGLVVATTVSEVRIPLHKFILAGRSQVFRHALVKFQAEYFFEIPDVLTIEYDKEGQTLVTFKGLDFITILNLVLYLYTDSLVDVWHYTSRSPQQAFRYRQIRIELMKLASHLDMKKLEHATRMMTEPPKTLHEDLQAAIRDPAYFDSGDVVIKLQGRNIRAHSALMCQRCPFFEGLYAGRSAGRWLSSRREEGNDAIEIDLSHITPKFFDFILDYLYGDADEHMFDQVEASDLDSFLDVILDVMFVANELMLDRMSQSCQRLIGRFVNTRNVCQLLNEIASCSVSTFKDAAFEYICMNLEGMLENRLLGGLEDDLMLELDEVVRHNQMTLLPVTKSDPQDEELYNRHPELKESAARSMRIKLDAVVLHTRLHDRESRLNPAVRGGKDLSEDFETSTPSKARRRASGSQQEGSQPPLKAKRSTDLMFDMEEEHDQVSDKTGGSPRISANRRTPTPVGRSPLLSTSLVSDDGLSRYSELPPAAASFPIQDAEEIRGTHEHHDSILGSPGESSKEPSAWAAQSPYSSKLDMKEIMAQASSSRVSSISSGLKMKQKEVSQPSTPLRLSQRERKKRQQTPQMEVGEVSRSMPEESAKEVAASPWRQVSSAPKVNLKETLSQEQVPVKPPPRTSSPMTLRQTVSGRPQEKRRAASEQHQAAPTSRPAAGSSTAKPQPSSPVLARRAISSSSALPAASSPSSPQPQIQSIRHIPKATDVASLEEQLSMTDILSQQAIEKQSIKEAAAKRSLQEIQQEQEFQEWWDQESRRVREEEDEKEKAASSSQATSRKGRPSTSGRGRRRSRKTDAGSNDDHAADKSGPSSTKTKNRDIGTTKGDGRSNDDGHRKMAPSGSIGDQQRNATGSRSRGRGRGRGKGV